MEVNNVKDDYSRKLPAARSKEPGFVKLTPKQWSVYYWLVIKAYWNSIKKEQHYFVYADSFSLADVRRDLGIKDNRTIKSAMEKLELYNKINIVGNIIYIPHPDLYTYLSIDLTNYLLNICAAANISSELIVAYSILKRLKELDDKNGSRTTFTLKLIVKLLGHNETDRAAYELARVFVSLLSGEGLIKVSQTVKKNKGGEYIEYTLWDIKEKLDKGQLIDFDGEMAVEIQNRVKEILEQD
jgi:hypothetical protein